MFDVSLTTEILARALDVCAMKQAVYSANVANANVDGYRRLEVIFDQEALRHELAMNASTSGKAPSVSAHLQPHVVESAEGAVKLDEEMALMARNALRYQMLLAAYERSTGLVKAAIHEGKGV